MIKIESLTKTFDSKTIIDDLSLSLPQKGIVTISGPSGCGKSTLIRIIAGLTPFDKGSVSFSMDERVSMAFQSPTLLKSLTVIQNVNLVSHDKDKSISLLKELGIEDINKYPNELSGGMAARVNLARALLKGADIYLFDEPLAALDASNARKVLDVILDKTKDKLVIMVIHDEALAKEISSLMIKVTESPLSKETVTLISK